MATTSFQAVANLAISSAKTSTEVTCKKLFASPSLSTPWTGQSQSFEATSTKTCIRVSRRNAGVLCAVSTATPSVSTEDRKQAAEDSASTKAFRLEEVESAPKREYSAAEVLAVRDVAQGVRCITVDAEISREFVELSKAYTTPGQKVEVRLSGGDVVVVPVSSPPFPSESNHAVLLKLRGDIPAGSTKLAQYGVSVKAPLDLHVSGTSGLFNVQPGEVIEIGPFQAGVDLRPIMFLARYPIVLIFARGDGIAPARALIEANDVGSLFLNMREEVRFYYSAASPADVAYTSLFSTWEARKVKVRPTVDSTSGQSWEGFVGSFTELFDEDDLEYDPETTGAILFGSKESNDGVTELLKEAGLPDRAIIRWDV